MYADILQLYTFQQISLSSEKSFVFFPKYFWTWDCLKIYVWKQYNNAMALIWFLVNGQNIKNNRLYLLISTFFCTIYVLLFRISNGGQKTAGDVLNDIGSMLADLTDELDAMLHMDPNNPNNKAN